MREEIRRMAEKWGLEELRPMFEGERHGVFEALSPEYGQVILKYNPDEETLAGEYAMLTRVEGFPKVYACLPGALLEARILPGTPLRAEEDLKTRIHALKAVFHDIHTEALGEEAYLSWLRSAREECEKAKRWEIWLRRAGEAEEICGEMFMKYPERVLLHGDLHHDNLLLNDKGGYTPIDPKGVAGPEILDLPRFILNEVGMASSLPEAVHISRVLDEISLAFGYSREDLVKCFRMEAVLSCLWSLEDGQEPFLAGLELSELMMAEKDLYEKWTGEEKIAHIHGWDFSHIEGRYMEEDDLPWDYRTEILRYLRPEMRILDIDTGGGEFLLSLGHPQENTAATEGYGPNVELCRKTLLPLGIDFRPANGSRELPFESESFDMVINRHGDFNAEEIFRVLKPGGMFLTQQVGAENDRELVALLMGQMPLPFPEQYLTITEEKFRKAGFEILEGRECFRPIRFYDVGALVWFARIIEWEFPGFSVEDHFEHLLQAQLELERKRVLEGSIHRFLLLARKPRS